MKCIGDGEGSATFGWVGAHVYFSRFAGRLSVELGGAHVADLQCAIEGSAALRYFSDSSALTSYDLLARSGFIRLLLAHRKKFAELVFLNWTGNLAASSKLLIAAVGEPIVVLGDRDDFERRLFLAAPRAVEMANEARALPVPANGSPALGR